MKQRLIELIFTKNKRKPDKNKEIKNKFMLLAKVKLIGRTRDGRFLALFLEKEKDEFKLITARDATKTEKELYKKKVK